MSPIHGAIRFAMLTMTRRAAAPPPLWTRVIAGCCADFYSNRRLAESGESSVIAESAALQTGPLPTEHAPPNAP